MPATTPQTLYSESSCFRCFGAVNDVQLMRLALLARIYQTLVPMAATDPQTLMAWGKCFQCNGEASVADMMELALLDMISQNITGGGGGGVTGCCSHGTGSPEGVVVADIGAMYADTTDPANPDFYIKTANDGLNTGWVLVIT